MAKMENTCQWRKISKYLTVINHLALRGSLITHCIISDASECGYGQATYLRMVNDLEEVHPSLIFGESRVASVKYVSIPLELDVVRRNLKDVVRRIGHPYQF